MKKLLLSVLLMGMASMLHAAQPDFIVPVSVNGIADPGLKSAGLETVKLVTSSNAVLVTDRDGTTITDGWIHWIVRPSTAANGTFLEMRDTATANLGSARIIPQIAPVTIAISSATQPIILTFDPPIPFYNGLSVNTLPAGASGSVVGTEYAVGVRWKKQ